MSIIDRSLFRHGYYDENGQWQRTKFCFMACRRCDCSPPGGYYYSKEHDKRRPLPVAAETYDENWMLLDAARQAASHVSGQEISRGLREVECKPEIIDDYKPSHRSSSEDYQSSSDYDSSSSYSSDSSSDGGSCGGD